MFSLFTLSLRGMWGVNLGQSPTGPDLLTQGPKPGPASWLGIYRHDNEIYIRHQLSIRKFDGRMTKYLFVSTHCN